MLHPAVDDVGLADTAAQRLEAALDLGEHAAGDGARRSIIRRARSLSIVLMSCCLASKTPSTSVRRMSFSALSAAATSPATMSALML